MSRRRRRREVDPDDELVDMEMGLPNGMGSYKTKVTKKAADANSHTFMGGLLVAVGVLVAGMFGFGRKT
ncbi:MAG TPA: hypothetical protein VFE62_19955 [Gemmataceae bacterium]|nr:hypothetical protein [Gemmataceae bacterium]